MNATIERIARFAVHTALIAGVALAGELAHAGEPRTHDGFFLRLSAGGGRASTSIDVAGLETELSGRSGDLNIAVGGVIAPNLALHGTLFGWGVYGPDVEFLGGTEEDDDGWIALSAWGGGLTYYFMPVNLYLSGSLGLGSLAFETDDFDTDSDSGLVGELSLGKEWWVGGSWGLGIAGSYGFHSVPHGSVDEDWNGSSWSVRFSATLN